MESESLASDPDYHEYGTPFFLSLEGNERITEFHQLLISQDTGSAIKGPLRGDVFFGYVKEAEKNASNWQQTGKVVKLVPKE